MSLLPSPPFPSVTDVVGAFFGEVGDDEDRGEEAEEAEIAKTVFLRRSDRGVNCRALWGGASGDADLCNLRRAADCGESCAVVSGSSEEESGEAEGASPVSSFLCVADSGTCAVRIGVTSVACGAVAFDGKVERLA